MKYWCRIIIFLSIGLLFSSADYASAADYGSPAEIESVKQAISQEFQREKEYLETLNARYGLPESARASLGNGVPYYEFTSKLSNANADVKDTIKFVGYIFTTKLGDSPVGIDFVSMDQGKWKIVGGGTLNTFEDKLAKAKALGSKNADTILVWDHPSVLLIANENNYDVVALTDYDCYGSSITNKISFAEFQNKFIEDTKNHAPYGILWPYHLIEKVEAKYFIIILGIVIAGIIIKIRRGKNC